MPYKIFTGVIAIVLFVVYLGAPLVKLKDPALAVVLLIGIALMLVDLWQSLRSKD